MRKGFFWLAVAGVSVLSNVGLEVAANRLNSPGLKRFAALAHYGAGAGGNANSAC